MACVASRLAATLCWAAAGRQYFAVYCTGFLGLRSQWDSADAQDGHSWESHHVTCFEVRPSCQPLENITEQVPVGQAVGPEVFHRRRNPSSCSSLPSLPTRVEWNRSWEAWDSPAFISAHVGANMVFSNPFLTISARPSPHQMWSDWWSLVPAPGAPARPWLCQAPYVQWQW